MSFSTAIIRLYIGVAWRLFVLGIKMTWGIAKFVCSVLLFPLFLVRLVCIGMIYVAIPVLIIVGIVVLIGGAAAT